MNPVNTLSTASSSAHARSIRRAEAADSAIRKTKPAIEKVAQMAHRAVDKAAASAVPAADWIGEKTDRLDATQKKLVNDTCAYISANPLTAIGLALPGGRRAVPDDALVRKRASSLSAEVAEPTGAATRSTPSLLLHDYTSFAIEEHAVAVAVPACRHVVVVSARGHAHDLAAREALKRDDRERDRAASPDHRRRTKRTGSRLRDDRTTRF
jgi:hypothetical protein